MGEARLNRKGSPPSFPALVQQFFTEYLVAQRALSPRTVACYRDAMTLFLVNADLKLIRLSGSCRFKTDTPLSH